jgi:hypothetical protein
MEKSPKAVSPGIEFSWRKGAGDNHGSPNVDSFASKVLELHEKGKTVKQILNHHSLVDTGISDADVQRIIEQFEAMHNGDPPKKNEYNNIQLMAKRQAMLLVQTELELPEDTAQNQVSDKSAGSDLVSDALRKRILDLHSKGKTAKQIALNYSLVEYKLTEGQVQQILQISNAASSPPGQKSTTPSASSSQKTDFYTKFPEPTSPTWSREVRKSAEILGRLRSGDQISETTHAKGKLGADDDAKAKKEAEAEKQRTKELEAKAKKDSEEARAQRDAEQLKRMQDLDVARARAEGEAARAKREAEERKGRNEAEEARARAEAEAARAKREAEAMWRWREAEETQAKKSADRALTATKSAQPPPAEPDAPADAAQRPRLATKAASSGSSPLAAAAAIAGPPPCGDAHGPRPAMEVLCVAAAAALGLVTAAGMILCG